MIYLFSILLILLAVSLLLLKRDRRSILGGLLLGVTLLLSLLFIFFTSLFILSEHNIINSFTTLIIVYLVLPIVVLAICVGLIFNSGLMRHKEGKSLVAKLSIGLGLNILIVLPFTLYLLSTARQIPFWILGILFFLCITDLLFVLLFTSYLVYSWIYQSIPIKGVIDYIIVLGSGIRSEEVSPLLKSRLDKALSYYHQWDEQPILVVSGGQGPDEPISEAAAMKKYLLSQGVAANNILVEDRSVNTYQNMLYSKELIKQHDPAIAEKKIIFSTSNYHVLRAAGFAKRVHLKAEGVGAPTALYFLPSALIREFIGLLVQYKWGTLFLVFLCALLVFWAF